MKNKEEKIFNSEFLQDAYEKTKNTINISKEYIGKISDDIKFLEKHLRENIPIFPFYYQIWSDFFIAWDKFNGDKFRLLLVIKGECKPLIECKLQTRIDVYPHLPEFLLFINDEIKSKSEK